MRERRRADVRRLGIDRSVELLGDPVRDQGEPFHTALGQTREALLELEVRDDRGEVRVAGSLPEPVQGALHVSRTGADSGHRVGDRAAGVVVAVDADRDITTDMGVHLADDLVDLVGQRAAIGVAEHDMGRTLQDRRLERPERELRVRLVPVEEVLHVDEHPAPVPVEELDRVGDHRSALVEGRLEGLDDVVVPALGNDAHRRRVRVEQVLQRLILVDLAARSPRRPERDERRRGEVELVRSSGEELDVLGVGTGPSTFDEVHAEVVELLGDAELVLDGRRDTFDLQAVAEGGVEDLDRPAQFGAARVGVTRVGLVHVGALSVGRATKKPPGGRRNEHVGRTCSTK